MKPRRNTSTTGPAATASSNFHAVPCWSTSSMAGAVAPTEAVRLFTLMTKPVRVGLRVDLSSSMPPLSYLDARRCSHVGSYAPLDTAPAIRRVRAVRATEPSLRISACRHGETSRPYGTARRYGPPGRRCTITGLSGTTCPGITTSTEDACGGDLATLGE
jgi:hypothetical protein